MFSFHLFQDDECHLKVCKIYADELIDEKLAKFIDEKKTMLEITNFGKFWMLQGGYMEYLKQSEKKYKAKDNFTKEKDIEDELTEARLRFTQYRIKTYWVSFILAVLGFLFSLISLILVSIKLK